MAEADIHIEQEGLEALKAFGDNERPAIRLREVSVLHVDAAELRHSANSMPEGDTFRETAATTSVANKKFLTDVYQGFDAFEKGATNMAATIEAGDQQMGKTMADVTTRDPGQAEILRRLTNPTS